MILSASSVLARKWRPRNFAQLAGQEHVVRALANALQQNRLHHAYLFTGTRGVGKTTIARIFAKSLNCESGVTAEPCGACSACTEIDSGRFADLIELDAASNTQVDSMRELLESALYAPTSGRFKVYIIDEVHMLSKSAFNAMLKTLEEPPAHVKFILATTDPQKIPVTVLSRCLQFNLKQLPPQLILKHLQHVLDQEEIEYETSALSLIARAAQGSMRDALSLLDQAIAFAAGRVGEGVVRNMLGAVDQGYLYDVLGALLAMDGGGLLTVADAMQSRSIAFDTALQELASLLHRIALAQVVPQAIDEDEPDRERLLDLALALSAEEVQLYYQIAIHGRNDIDLAPDEYAGFTMTLLRMLAFRPTGHAAVRTTAAVQTTPRQTSSVAQSAAATEPSTRLDARIPGQQLDWNELVRSLNLQALALELAKNCVLESYVDGTLTLNLAPTFKHLLNSRMAQDKLQTALSEYFAQPVRLQLALAASQEVTTPAEVEQQVKQARQQRAEESIRNDPFVREVQQQLNAQLVESSIKPIQQQ